MADKKQQVSRRQFLNYTLTGVGGFMAAGMLAPMVRFAIDPVLQPKKKGEFISVVEVEKLTNEPQRFDFEFEQEDAWYTSTVTKSAWVYIDENEDIIAMSPVCTHLGCTVSWEGNEDYPDQFFCPCHDGRYEKDGTNIKGTPPPEPLHRYEHQIDDGMLYLSTKAKPRGEA